MEKALASLDLFSGIGGLTLALEGFAKPIMYCDRDTDSYKVLNRLMKEGLLPTAPIHGDIAMLNKNAIPRGKKVDMIMGGFPCVGFSAIGKRKGFKNEESGLYGHIIRLVDELNPNLVFLENVPDILTMGMSEVCKDFRTRNYDLRWCILTAEQFGAVHKRKRWFCLAIKRGFKGVILDGIKTGRSKVGLTWRETPEPARLTLTDVPENKRRAALLGNSVVPYCVRYAFLYLLGGFKEVVDMNPKRLEIKGVDVGFVSRQKNIKVFAKRGCMIGGVLYDIIRDLTPELGDTLQKKLVFDPKVFVSTKPQSKGPDGSSSPLVTKPIVKPLWSTPRHGMTGTSNYLTQRTVRDLPTQLRFERGTPDHLRPGHMSARFVEWMMGYPKDWTRLG